MAETMVQQTSIKYDTIDLIEQALYSISKEREKITNLEELSNNLETTLHSIKLHFNCFKAPNFNNCPKIEEAARTLIEILTEEIENRRMEAKKRFLSTLADLAISYKG